MRLKRLRRPKLCSMRAASLVEGLGEEGRLVLFVGLVGDHRRDAAGSGGHSVGLAGIALVGDGGAGRDVRSDVEQDLEMTPVRGLAAGQVEGD